MKSFIGLFFTLNIFLIFLPALSSSQQLTLICDPCYVYNCQCFVDCDNGKMYVYTGASFGNTAGYTIQVENKNANFMTVQPGQYFARVDCTSTGELSSCQSLYVTSYPGQTTPTPSETTTTTTTTPPETTQTTTSTAATGATQQTQITTRTGTTRTTTTTGVGSPTLQAIDILFLVLAIAAIAVAIAAVLHYIRSKQSDESRNYDSLKQKWTRLVKI